MAQWLMAGFSFITQTQKAVLDQAFSLVDLFDSAIVGSLETVEKIYSSTQETEDYFADPTFPAFRELIAKCISPTLLLVVMLASLGFASLRARGMIWNGSIFKSNIKMSPCSSPLTRQSRQASENTRTEGHVEFKEEDGLAFSRNDSQKLLQLAARTRKHSSLKSHESYDFQRDWSVLRQLLIERGPEALGLSTNLQQGKPSAKKKVKFPSGRVTRKMKGASPIVRKSYQSHTTGYSRKQETILKLRQASPKREEVTQGKLSRPSTSTQQSKVKRKGRYVWRRRESPSKQQHDIPESGETALLQKSQSSPSKQQIPPVSPRKNEMHQSLTRKYRMRSVSPRKKQMLQPKEHTRTHKSHKQRLISPKKTKLISECEKPPHPIVPQPSPKKEGESGGKRRVLKSKSKLPNAIHNKFPTNRWGGSYFDDKEGGSQGIPQPTTTTGITSSSKQWSQAAGLSHIRDKSTLEAEWNNTSTNQISFSKKQRNVTKQRRKGATLKPENESETPGKSRPKSKAKRCKTCKKIRKAPYIPTYILPTKDTSRNGNPGSVFYLIPNEIDFQKRKSEYTVCAPKKTPMPHLSSLEGKGAFRVYSSGGEDTNMNKSGMKCNKDRHALKSNETDSTAFGYQKNRLFCENSFTEKTGNKDNRNFQPTFIFDNRTNAMRYPPALDLTNTVEGYDENKSLTKRSVFINSLAQNGTDRNTHIGQFRSSNYTCNDAVRANDHRSDRNKRFDNDCDVYRRERNEFSNRNGWTHNHHNNSLDVRHEDPANTHVVESSSSKHGSLSDGAQQQSISRRKLLYKRRNLSVERPTKPSKLKNYFRRSDRHRCKSSVKNVPLNDTKHSNNDENCRCPCCHKRQSWPKVEPSFAHDQPSPITFGLSKSHVDKETADVNYYHRSDMGHEAARPSRNYTDVLANANHNRANYARVPTTAAKCRKADWDTTNITKKRRDKIKSFKWRTRHEPYKVTGLKTSVKYMCPVSNGASLTPRLAPMLPNVTDFSMCQLNTMLRPAVCSPTSERELTLNSYTDPTSFSAGFPKNKNNCGPFRRDNTTLMGVPEPLSAITNNSHGLIERSITNRAFRSLSANPLTGENERARNQSVLTANTNVVGLNELIERERSGPNNNHMNTDQQTLIKDISSQEMQVADTNFQHESNQRQDISPPQIDTNVPFWDKQPQPRATTHTTQRRTTKLCSKRGQTKHSTATNKYLPRTHVPQRQLPSAGRLRCFKNLGIQTANICSNHIAVQTSPEFECSKCQHKSELAQKRGHDTHDPANKTDPVARCPGKRCPEPDTIQSPTDSPSTPDTLLTKSRPAFNSGERSDNNKQPKTVIKQTACEYITDENVQRVGDNTSTKKNSMRNVNHRQHENTSDNTSIFLITNMDSKTDTCTGYPGMDSSALKSSGIGMRRERSFPSTLSSSPPILNPPSNAGSSSSVSLESQSCMARPRWEDANVDEINRRVERALRLRQELQLYRSGKGVPSQKTINDILNPASCLSREQVEAKLLAAALSSHNETAVSQKMSSSSKGTSHCRAATSATGTRCVTTNYSTKEVGTAADHEKPPHSEEIKRKKDDGTAIPSDNSTVLEMNWPYSLPQTGPRSLGNAPSEGTTANATGDGCREIDSSLHTTGAEKHWSFDVNPTYTLMDSTTGRPLSAATLSRMTTVSAEDSDRTFVTSMNPAKNSPPTRISKMENVIQSEYPRLVSELVQALPHVPLASFVEWFIETSNPDHFNSSDGSSSTPEATSEIKPTNGDLHSVSAEHLVSVSRTAAHQIGNYDFVPERSHSSAKNVAEETMTTRDTNATLKLEGDPRNGRNCENGDAEFKTQLSTDVTEIGDVSSIRRILLTRRGSVTEKSSEDDGVDKRRSVTIRQRTMTHHPRATGSGRLRHENESFIHTALSDNSSFVKKPG